MMPLDPHFLRTWIRTMDRYPQSPAWSDQKHRFTYRQFASIVSHQCNILQTLGIEAHQRVLLVSDVHLEQIVLFYSLSLLGAIVVIHAPIKNADDWAFLHNDIQPQHTFTHFCSAQSRWTSSLFYAQGNQPPIQFKIDPNKQSMQSIREWISPSVISSDCAMILYTSGSTARPKGIMLSHRNIQVARDAIIQYLAMNHQDTVYSVLPFHFDYGLYQSILCFSVGAHLIQAKAVWTEAEILKQCKQHAISILPITPHFCNLLKKVLSDESVVPGIRTITSTGAPLLSSQVKSLQSWFPSAKIFSMYGLSECKRAMTIPPDSLHCHMDRNQLPLGIAIPNTRAFAINDTGHPIQAHEEGELVIMGDHVMMGYWNRPGNTSLQYCERTQQWRLHTGDWVRKDGHDNLFYQGRKDEMFKCKGERVSPKHIETQLMNALGIEACVACPYPMNEGETGIALVYSGEMIEPDIMKLTCRQLLPGSHQPEQWLYLRTLPSLPNGKIDRRGIRQWCRQVMAAQNP